MSIEVALNHKTHYHFDRLVGLYPHTFRLRPAPHSRTPIKAYSLRIDPAEHFITWQQDPFGNYLARVVFPQKTRQLSVEVELIADMTVINPFDYFLEEYAEHFPFAYEPDLGRELAPYLEIREDGPLLTAWLAEVDRSQRQSNDFLVALNQRLCHDVEYALRMENGGSQSHTYSQVWNFLPRVEEEDGRGTVYGFDLQDIHTDDAAQRISTAQVGAPNVALHHFSPHADVKYHTYYEETERYLVPFTEERREVYLGWFARHIEDRLGAADVHAAWRGKPASTSVLVTAIVPSRTEQSRVIEALDTSKGGIAGCLLTLEGGDRIGFSTGDADDAALNVLGHQRTARSLLVYQPQEGEVRGMSIDAEGGVEFVGVGMTEVGMVQVPTGFAWRQTDSGFVPEYE